MHSRGYAPVLRDRAAAVAAGRRLRAARCTPTRWRRTSPSSPLAAACASASATSSRCWRPQSASPCCSGAAPPFAAGFDCSFQLRLRCSGGLDSAMPCMTQRMSLVRCAFKCCAFKPVLIEGILPYCRQPKSAHSLLCRNFEFQFSGSAADVGMASGATIHTANGLRVRVARRTPSSDGVPSRAEPVAAGV